MQRLEYRLTELDLRNYNVHHSANSSFYRTQRRLHRIVLPAAYALLMVPLCLLRSFVAASILAVAGVAWFLLSPGWLRMRHRRQCAKHIRETVGDSLRSPMILELRPEGILSSNAMGDSTYRYSAVDRIEEDDGVTYVYIGKGMALVLPHDRIPKDAIDSFLAEIAGRRQAAIHSGNAGSAPAAERSSTGDPG